MLDLIIDLASIAFLLLTGTFCLSWVLMRNALDKFPPKSTRPWIGTTLKVLACLIGAWHMAYGLLGLLYLILWMVTT